MKISLAGKLTKQSIKELDGIFIPIFLKQNKIVAYGEVLKLLQSADRAIIMAELKRHPIKAGETRFVAISSGQRILIAGFESIDRKNMALAMRKFTRAAKAERLERLGLNLDDLAKDELAASELAELLATEGLLAHYDFGEVFKTEPKEGWPRVRSISLFSRYGVRALREALDRGVTVGEAVNRARTLSNYPPGEMTPVGVAQAASDLAREYPELQVTVFDEHKMEAMGMNAILAVGKGSANPPRLIVMEYYGADSKEKPLALVGKGITFDSGGLNLKPAEGMQDMHLDMSGGASVVSAMGAIAALKLPINVLAVVAAAENMPSGFSYRQGDIIKSYSGKTIEIGNTDAEGRVVLADAISYAKTKKPALIVTLATLTGAAISALGTRFSALFVKDNPELRDAFQKISEESGDALWPLPLTDDHKRDVEGHLADVTNTHKNHSRYGGASTGAAFLSCFAEDAPFAHIDMAPRMLANPEEEHLAKGSVGFGVRFFVKLAEKWSDIQKFLIPN